jgi:arylsulfatase A-like enzyme
MKKCKQMNIKKNNQNNTLIKYTLSILLLAFTQLQAQQKPNILIIISDELSAESMSANLGSKYLKTPNMDYLAKNGVSFTNAYCANPLCIPSRSSLFTGRYPHEMGIQSNAEKNNDPIEFPAMGTIFKNAGYETGYVGKWHLPYNRVEPETHGFNYLPNKKGNGDDSLSPILASEFLNTKRTNPFLLVVSFMNPHNICQWARGDKLPDGPIGTPPTADQCPPLRPNSKPSKNETDIMQLMRTSFQASDAFPVGDFSDDKWRQYIWAYYRLIEKVDAEIGKVLDALRASGQDKNTLIVFTADHGDCQGAHHWNQKTVFYEEAAKVPFIFNYNGLKPAKSNAMIQTGTDLLPTLCEFAGLPLPNKTRGIGLKKILTGAATTIDRKFVVVSDHLVQGAAVNGKIPMPEGRMIRNQQFKYWIYNEGMQRETLYDIKNDPYELVNLVNDPKYQTALKDCRAQLMEWAVKNKDPYINNLVK